jgi:acetyltransferase
VIVDNLWRGCERSEALVIVKPGHTEFLGRPCVSDVRAFAADPVDLLIVALPAPEAVGIVDQLLAQGGGATAVALVAGGLGDGADTAGLGPRLAAQLHAAREAGRWTPAILGPNFLGHWVPATGLDSSFILADKLAPPPHRDGPLVVLSQSGAFLLCRRSRHPHLRFGLGVTLGNQLDVALPDFLAGLADDPACGAVAAYVEGFGPEHLAATAAAAARLRTAGKPFLLHRAGRTSAGQAAAATHTGAMAADIDLERAVLERAGVKLSDSIVAFDAALTWLGVYPRPAAGPVALVTNAGFESVNVSDLTDARLPGAALPPDAVGELAGLLAASKLGGLVTPRLPLDLTPMASESAYLRAAELLFRSEAAVIVAGLVPFTCRLETGEAGAEKFALALAEVAARHGKPLGVAVDAGPEYEHYRAAFVAAGLPVFGRVEEALLGLRALA